MKKRRKMWRRIGVMALAAIVLTGAAAVSSPVSASASSAKKKQLQKNLDEAEALIKKLKEDKSDVESAITQLDKKMVGIENEIVRLEDEIEKTKAELEEAKADEKVQEDGMKLRIRFMYQNSGMSVLEALLSSESFADFLNQAEYFNEIMDYDREMLDKYQETRQKIEDAEKKLEDDQAQMAEEKKAVQSLLDEKESQLAKLGSELDEAEEEAAVYKKKIAAENEIIAQMQAAETRYSAPSGGSYSGGTFSWPCPSSSRITSGFGGRSAPTAGASTYHKGIDIGASYGAAIVAAADGVVTVAGYNGAYGNYVTISHGGGLSTMYCHCSSLVVSAGQKVSRGQTVAKVGSTGISTGSHLHFQVMQNGSAVNPLNYL